MATFSIYRSTLPLYFLIFHLLTLYPVSILSLITLTSGNPNFDPQIALLGDVRITDNGSHVRLTNPNASSSGLLFYKDPFKILDSNTSKMASFSTEFEFLFEGNGIGLSLIMGSSNFASKFLGQGPFKVSNEKGYLGIEFCPSVKGNVGDSNTTLVSLSVNNEPPKDFETKSGEKLKSWIDYDASSRRLEVRVSKISDKRPFDPLIALFIDLSKMWEDNVVYVALGSRNGGNLSETCYVYSWRFKLRKVPYWMHSLPVDPNAFRDHSNTSLRVRSRKLCPLTVLAGMIFATGCGALLAFMVLFVWAIIVNRRMVFTVEGNVLPVEFRYEKIGVVVEKDEKVVKN